MPGLRAFIRDHRRAVTVAVVVGCIALVVIAGALAGTLMSGRETAGGSVSSEMPSVRPSSTAMEPIESPSAAPSTDPTSTASATPQASVGPATDATYGDDPFAAVVRVDGLRLRRTPGEGVVVDVLERGDVVLLDYPRPEVVDGMTWYAVLASNDASGWIAAGPEPSPWIELRYSVARRSPAWVEGLAGGDGFVAWGIPGGTPWPDPGERFVAASPDGVDWQLGIMPPEAQSADDVLVAYGMETWLMIATDTSDPEAGPATTVHYWQSDDGFRWEAIQMALDVEPVAVFRPSTLVGSTWGFMLDGDIQCSSGYYCDPGWETDDLVTWTGRDDPINWARSEPLGDGFLTWHVGPDVNQTYFVAGTEGWIRLLEGDHAGLWGPAPVAAVGDVLITTMRTDGGSPPYVREVWTATIPDIFGLEPADDRSSPLEWVSRPNAASVFDGSTVPELVSIGDVALAIGQSYADGSLRVWQSTDGASWEVVDTTALEGTTVGRFVAASDGVVVMPVDAWTVAGANPRFARWTPAGGWEVEEEPVLGTIESPVVGDCPDVPATALDWMAIPGPVGAACFGSTDVTFRAWVTAAPDGYGNTWIPDPHWPLLGVRPIERYGDAGRTGIVSLAPEIGSLDVDQWAQVTGHWNDPRATCGVRPDRMWPMLGLGGGAVGQVCPSTFVAVRIEPER